MNIRASDDISFFIDGYDNIYVDTLASNTGMSKKKNMTVGFTLFVQLNFPMYIFSF